MQYLLYDPVSLHAATGDGGFASGLVFSSGKAKPGMPPTACRCTCR